MPRINPNGVIALAKDVDYLADFVDSLDVPILKENLDELQQTINLLQSENSDEFYDISTRNKKYGRVDAMNGPMLLEKYATSLFLVSHPRKIFHNTNAFIWQTHALGAKPSKVR